MDDKTKTIGIYIDFHQGWIGGINYLINIINSFNYLEKTKKPEVIIFSSIKKGDVKTLITYPNVKFVEIIKQSYFLTFIKSLINNKNFFIHEKMKECDLIYPFNDFPIKKKPKRTKFISWIPDFQHKIYKRNFSFFNLILREYRFKLINRNSDLLILSSNDAIKDYEIFYNKTAKKVEVIPFVSVIEEDYKNKEILKRYDLIENQYFIVSNQFHVHKNFEIVINSFEKFYCKNKEYKLIITGTAGKNNRYYSRILDLVTDQKSKKNIIFTGFLKKSDVLSLIYFSKCLIQPSKFEGWNTAIEDCKSMGVSVIASNIGVHLEQLKDQGNYFNINDPETLEHLFFNHKQLKKSELPTNHKRYREFANLIIKKFVS